MSASLLSSFLVFVVYGIFEIFGSHPNSWYSHIDDILIQRLITGSVWANAVYFFYCAALVEWHASTKAALQKPNVSRFEWFIRLSNQTLILLAWHALNSSVEWFCFYLFVLYSSFLLWDYATRSVGASDKFIKWFDIGGFVASFLFVGLVYSGRAYDQSHPAPPSYWAGIGIICACYIAVAIGGLLYGWLRVRFRPFYPEYWARDRLY
jgi:hypothetical protein